MDCIPWFHLGSQRLCMEQHCKVHFNSLLVTGRGLFIEGRIRSHPTENEMPVSRHVADHIANKSCAHLFEMFNT